MASSGTYRDNHRNNPNPRQQSLQRFGDAVDTIKHEFDVLQSERDTLGTQKEEYESQISLQINEVNAIRRSLTDLETQQSKIRQSYEDELHRLRVELASLRPSPHLLGIPGLRPLLTPRLGPPPAPVPVPAVSGTSNPERDRDETNLERERERGRDKAGWPTPLEKEGEWEMKQQHQNARKAGERRDQERDDDRLSDWRDLKRLKTDTKRTLSPSIVANKTPPANILYSTSGPAFHSHAQPPLREGQVMLPPIHLATTSATSGHRYANSPEPDTHQITNQTAIPEPQDLSIHTVPPEFRKEGSDWSVAFNPKVKKTLDITLVHTLVHPSVVCCVQFSHDGKYLATGCNWTAQIFDVKTGKNICVLTDESAGKSDDLYIRSVRFSPDGKLLATGAEDRKIRIWDIATKRIRHIFSGHQQEIYSLDFSLDGRFIVSGSGDRTARIWDLSNHFPSSIPQSPPGNTPPPGTLSKVLTIPSTPPSTSSMDSGITSVAISPDSRFIAAGSLDAVVRIWDVASGRLVERLEGHKDSVYSVAFTRDGKGLVSGSLDQTLKGWDVSGVVGAGTSAGISSGFKLGEKEGTAGWEGGNSNSKPSSCTTDFVGHKDFVLSVAVSHDGQWVVSGSKDRYVHFWDARNATLQFALQGHKNSVISLDLNPAGGMLATGSGDNLARIWRYSTVQK